jgi:hypothetical protein
MAVDFLLMKDKIKVSLLIFLGHFNLFRRSLVAGSSCSIYFSFFGLNSIASDSSLLSSLLSS